LITVSPILVNAQYVLDIEISLTHQVYHYGEKLNYTIIVSEVTGHDARIYITDPDGKRSPLVTIPISHEETDVIAPIGFDSIIWSEGKYLLELEYSDASHKTDFTIIDDGSVGIPYWIDDLAKLWLTSQIPDKEFVKGIEYLIEHKILDAPESDDELYIPKWFKFTTAWWSTDAITDTTYAHAIQFLINEKFMIIPFDQELSVSTTERSL
jgi:hypothetical protein